MARVAIEDAAAGRATASVSSHTTARPVRAGMSRSRQLLLGLVACAAFAGALALAIPEFTTPSTAYSPVVEVGEAAPSTGAPATTNLTAQPAGARPPSTIPNPIGGPHADLPPMPGSSRTPEDYEGKPRKGTP